MATKPDLVVLKASSDPVKRDLELTCTECDRHLYDAQDGDTLDVLVGMAASHTCGDNFTQEQKDEMSRAFSAGNYANAYDSTDLDDFDLSNESEHARAAWILGFFGSYSLDEIGSDREVFDAAYYSDAGHYVVKVAKYTDDRTPEYEEEQNEIAGTSMEDDHA